MPRSLHREWGKRSEVVTPQPHARVHYIRQAAGRRVTQRRSSCAPALISRSSALIAPFALPLQFRLPLGFLLRILHGASRLLGHVADLRLGSTQVLVDGTFGFLGAISSHA